MSDYQTVFAQGVWHKNSWEAMQTLPEITVVLPLLNKAGFLPIQHHLIEELTEIVSNLANQLSQQPSNVVEDPTRWSPEGDEMVEYISSLLAGKITLIPALTAIWVARKARVAPEQRQGFWMALKLRLISAYAQHNISDAFQRFLAVLLDTPLVLADDLNEALIPAAEALQLPLREEHVVDLDASLEQIIPVAKKRKKDPNAIAFLSLIGDREPKQALWADGGQLLPFASKLVNRSLRKRVAPVLHSLKSARALAVCWHHLSQQLKRWEVLTAFVRRLTVADWGYGPEIRSGIICIASRGEIDVDKLTSQIAYKHLIATDCYVVLLFEPQSNIVPIGWSLYSRLQQLPNQSKAGIAIGVGEVDYGTLLSSQGLDVRRLSLNGGIFVTREVQNSFFKNAPGVEGIISFTNDSFYTTRKDADLVLSRVATSELKQFLIKKKRDSVNTVKSTIQSTGQTVPSTTSLGLQIDVDEDDPIEL